MKSQDFISCENMPIIRIAPVCNGRIYVIPGHSADQLDLPLIERTASPLSKRSNKAARQLAQKHHSNLRTGEQPRFSVKYASPTDQAEDVYLYILPLNDEKEISFENGTFVSAEEIEAEGHRYSEYLQKESGLLGMAAELWQDYKLP